MRHAALVLGVVFCLLAAGCGGNDRPHVARADVAPLITLADRVATEGPCAQKRDLATLQRRAIALVNRKAVPPELQEPFVAGVNDLAGRAPVCRPPAPIPPPPVGAGHGKHGEHGKGHEKQDKGDKG